MPIEILVPVLVWILIGVACAVWIFLDMRKSGDMRWPWVVAGLLLAVVGVVLFHFLVRKKRASYQYPPKPEYDSPQYKMKAEPEAKKPEVRAESRPTVAPASKPAPVTTAKPAPAAAGAPAPAKRSTPAAEAQKVVEGKHVAKHIEGIPRCDHCGAAVSAHDMSCPGCGTSLK
jgi:hypothetical protein